MVMYFTIYLFIYLTHLKHRAHTRYRVKATISNSTAITGHKNAANVTPQRKHTEKHTV